MTSSVPFLVFPGVAGNFIETADTNELDADTAHIQQGIGGWQSLLAVSAVGQSTDLTPQFGSQHAVGTADGGLAFVTTPQFTAGFPVTVGQAYTASVDISANATGLQARVSIRWADGSGVTVQTDNGPYVSISQNQWLRGSASFTAPATAVYAAVRIEWDSPSASDKLYWDAACFRQGSDSVFVPSLRIVGVLDAVFDGSVAALSTNMDLFGFAPTATGGWSMFVRSNNRLAMAYNVGAGAQFTAGKLHNISANERAVFQLTRDPSTGTIEYFANGSSLGTDAGATGVQLYDAAAPFYVGRGSTVGNFQGSLWSCEVRDGIDGPVVARLDASDAATATVT